MSDIGGSLRDQSRGVVEARQTSAIFGGCYVETIDGLGVHGAVLINVSQR